MSSTPSFPKKVPIVIIATMATFLLSLAFITTGELLAGNVYRERGVVIFDEMEAHPVTAPARPAAAALRSAFAGRAAMDRSVTPADEEPAVALEPAPAPPAPVVAAATAAKEKPKAELSTAATDRIANALTAVTRITVVGAGRNVGTTSTAIALARALSQHSRVVLVDLALQSPNLAAISTEPSAPGMAELVRGAASFRHIITRDRASHVHLVAAGHVPADTSTVIRSERVVTAMNALAQTYDRVIVDAGAMPDATLERLARIAPHAVLVAPGAGDEVTAPAREHLLAAGFNDVTVFRDTPPRPDAASGPDTAAA